MLEKAIRKLNEVAQDLREPQDGANLEHQAKKIDQVKDDLQALMDLMLDVSTRVHGGGTGKK